MSNQEEVNFSELRTEMDQYVGQEIEKIDKVQNQRREHNDNELENVEFLKTENTTIQKQLVNNLVTKNAINDESEQENNTFLNNFDEHVHQKQGLYNQLFEIEYIMRLLKQKVSENQTTGNMINLVNQAQTEIMDQKNQEETKIVQLVTADIESQADSLSKQVQILEDQENRQNAIENNLESIWQESCEQMENEHSRYVEERAKLVADLADIRKRVNEKQESSSTVHDQATQVEAEVQRLRSHSLQLQQNLDEMVSNYDTQYEQCMTMISRNNDELNELRESHGKAVADFFDMSVKNESLEMRVLQQKGLRELNVDLNYEYEIEMMKSNTIDAMRKAHETQESCEQLIEHWKNRVSQMERHVAMVQTQTNEKVLTELVEHYMTQIDEKNTKIIEMHKQKVQIQSKLREPIEDESLDDLQVQLNNLMQEYNNIIDQKINAMNELFIKLDDSCKKDDESIKLMVDLYNMKNAIDIAGKDMHQKQTVQIEQETEAEEIQQKNEELKEEISHYEDTMLKGLKDQLQAKDDEVDDLHNQIREQEAVMEGLKREYDEKTAKKAAADAEVARAIEEQKEQDRIAKEAQLAKALKRVWYEPQKGDTVDEMMAKYLNECQYYVPVKRLGDSQYLYGQKKIYSKILNEKLVIRVGGGYELITKFLSMYAEQESKAYMESAAQPTPSRAQGSPKRSTMKKSPARTRKV